MPPVTPLEYRFRYLVHAVVYLLGFWAPWTIWLPWARQPSWQLLMSYIARTGWLSFNSAALLLLWSSIAFAALGAWMRTWGAAYVGAGVVQSHAMHGDALLADGPYRHTRNPLYLGTLLNTVAVALLMPPSGALFAIVLLWVFQFRLALAEEPFLTARFGEAYREYIARVPRFLPAWSPRVPPAGARPRWGQAVLGELYVIGVFITLAGFGWSFNVNTLIRGVLVSLGVSLIARAFLPKAQD